MMTENLLTENFAKRLDKVVGMMLSWRGRQGGSATLSRKSLERDKMYPDHQFYLKDATIDEIDRILDVLDHYSKEENGGYFVRLSGSEIRIGLCSNGRTKIFQEKGGFIGIWKKAEKQKEKENLDLKVQMLTQEKLEYEKSKKGLEEEIRELQKGDLEHKKEVQELDKKVRELTKEKLEHEKSKRDLEDEIRELRKDDLEHKKEIQGLGKKVKELTQERLEHEKSKRELEDEIRELRKDDLKYKKDIQKLSKQVKMLQRVSIALTVALTVLGLAWKGGELLAELGI